MMSNLVKWNSCGNFFNFTPINSLQILADFRNLEHHKVDFHSHKHKTEQEQNSTATYFMLEVPKQYNISIVQSTKEVLPQPQKFDKTTSPIAIWCTYRQRTQNRNEQDIGQKYLSNIYIPLQTRFLQ